jgi:hypothetical protein
MLLLSATVHVAIMKSSISTKDILQSHDQGMAVVRYGIATYAMLVWIAVSSIIPLRTWCYRFFYINHYISTLVFLGIAFQHVPTYARIPIYLATSIVALDKLLVAFFFLRNNISLTTPPRRFARSRSVRKFVAGFPVRMTTPSPSISTLAAPIEGSTTVIRIANIPFTWKPGQHIRLSIPSLGLFESHPFTPANCSAVPPPPLPPRKDLEPGLSTTQPRQTSEMLLMIKSKSGFTQRLAQYHTSWLARPCPNASSPADDTLTAYIDGPYGHPPTWHTYPNLVLLSSSTGVSLPLSILDSLEQFCFSGHAALSTRRITFIWLTRHLDPVFESSVTQTLARCASTLRDFGVTISAEFWHTCRASAEVGGGFDAFAHLRPRIPRRVSERPELRIRHPDEIYDEWEREAEEEEDDDGKSDVGPFVVDLDEYGSEEEEESGRSSAEWSVDEEDPFADGNEVRDEAYRPLPVPVVRRVEIEESCRCAVIQHQRGKVRSEKGAEFVVQRFGGRPDVKGLLGAVQAGDGERTMVAVCANSGVVRDVQSVAARVNAEFAMGRRKGRVCVHIEHQG